MGWFAKLLGRETETDTRAKPDSGFSKRGWESPDDKKREATTVQFLDLVGRGLAVAAMKVVSKPHDNEAELRGTLGGFPLKLSVDFSGGVRDATFKIGETRHEFLDLEYDDDLPEKPDDSVEPWEPSDKQVFVAPQIFFEGDDADKEAALFKAQLPDDLQARVLTEIRRLRIRYFRSRTEEFDITMHDDADEYPGDPVAWLVDTMKLALDVTRARGQVPPGQESTATHVKHEIDGVKPFARELAASLQRQLFGSKLVEDDDKLEIRWVESGVPVRIKIDSSFDDFDIEARAEGVGGDLAIQFDPDVTIEKKADSNDPWDELDRHIFFAKSVFVSGRETAARAQAAMVQSLGASLVADVVRTMEELAISEISLDDAVLYVNIDDASEHTDGGAKVLRVAKLLARIAATLPRGAVPAGTAAVRCTYCHGLWFPSPMQVTCSHCGARS